MKRVKKIVLLICIILLTGCQATYEININDNTISEKLKLIETNTSIFDVRDETGWTLRELYSSLLVSDQFSSNNYNVKSLSNDNRLGVEYKSKNLESVLNSSILNQCYINPSVEVKNDIVYIDTGIQFQCFEYYETLESIKIVLKTNHKVVSTNASEQKGNSYIWNFTKDSDKRIEVIYYQNEIKKSFDYITLIVIVFLVLCVGTLVYILLNKKKKNNEI